MRNSNTAELRHIPVLDIVEPEDQIRTVVVFEHLNELAESIKEKGIIEPLIVLQKNEKFEIVAGHRRYLAAKIAGLDILPCIVRSISNQDVDLIKLHENFFREDINPVDEGKYFVRLHEKHGLAYNEVARLCSRSDTYVLNRVQLLQSDESVLAALEAGQINYSQAVEIGRAMTENICHELLRITIESGATVESLRIMRHDYESRLANRDPSLIEESPKSERHPELKHLIACPVCEGSYPVNQIYPISVCKTCYDNFLKGLEGTG